MWRPTAPIENLKKRAEILKKIRHFFDEKGVLEVETPLMCHASVTDVHLHSIQACFGLLTKHPKTFYLQTSPEYAIKRLLAAGIGSVFEICKSFRDDETGRFHNPEFTMLEWYRIGFDHHDLMNEMDELFQTILNSKPAEKLSYQETFERYLNINPHTASLKTLKDLAKHVLDTEFVGLENEDDRDTWLQILMSHAIEEQLGQECPTFIYDYPETQAALSKIRKGNPSVAERFEVYIHGIELGNGFHELTNPKEQRVRFENDLKKRQKLGLPQLPLDEYFLNALEYGMPSCSGVAIGMDRLMMIALGAKHINDVIAFPLDRA